MAQKAAAALDLDLTKSWVVGDRAEDMNLAGEIGANGVFLGAEEDRHPAWGPFVYNYPSLAAAAPFIIEEITDVVLLDSFPSKRLPDPSHYIDAYREEQTLAFRSIDPQHFKAAALALQAAIRERHWVFTAGNGGSAAVANHLWCDHAKMIRHSTELRPRVMSLSASAEIMTAIANDIGFDSIFAYQLEGVAEPGDVLIVFSVSGQSLDVIRAVQWANEHGLKTIAVTAFGGGQARELADTSIHIKTDNYGIAEDIMQAVMHAFAQYIRQFEMTPEAIRYSRF
jgi:phosphoheptose isomerase